MPMSFPDMESLEIAAEVWGFRKIIDDETEIQYRTALADFVQDKDVVESMEIRSGKGWDEFSEGDNRATLAIASLPDITLLPELVSFPDGMSCTHRACVLHQSHPCETCGRIFAKGEATIPVSAIPQDELPTLRTLMRNKMHKML